MLNGHREKGRRAIASCETKRVCQKVAVSWCNTYQTGSAYRMSGLLAQTKVVSYGQARKRTSPPPLRVVPFSKASFDYLSRGLAAGKLYLNPWCGFLVLIIRATNNRWLPEE